MQVCEGQRVGACCWVCALQVSVLVHVVLCVMQVSVLLHACRLGWGWHLLAMISGCLSALQSIWCCTPVGNVHVLRVLATLPASIPLCVAGVCLDPCLPQQTVG